MFQFEVSVVSTMPDCYGQKLFLEEWLSECLIVFQNETMIETLAKWNNDWNISKMKQWLKRWQI